MFHDLHALISANDINGIKAALAQGADINAKDGIGRTSLLGAFRNMPSYASSEDDDEAAVLEAKKESDAIIELLMQHNPDVKIADSNGTTPLHVASKKNNLKWVEYLLARDADINALDNEEKTPLLLAIEQHNADDSLPLINILLKSGADTDAMDGRALHTAVEKRYLNIIKLLLDYRANPNILQNTFYGPFSVLHIAAKKLDFEIIHLLVGSPLIEVDIKGGFYGFTPLEEAIWRRVNTPSEELLLDFGALKEECEEHQKNKESYIKCMQSLVLKGARQNDTIYRDHTTEQQYNNEVLAPINSIIEFKKSIHHRFKFPDIDTTGDVLRLDTWQRQLLRYAVISRGELENKGQFFKQLPIELVHKILYSCFNHQLTLGQINQIFKDARFPFETAQPADVAEPVEAQPTTFLTCRGGR